MICDTTDFVILKEAANPTISAASMATTKPEVVLADILHICLQRKRFLPRRCSYSMLSTIGWAKENSRVAHKSLPISGFMGIKCHRHLHRLTENKYR